MRTIVRAAGIVNRQCSLNRGKVAWFKSLPGNSRGNIWTDLCVARKGTLTAGPVWSGPRGLRGSYGSLTLDGVDDVVTAANLDLTGAFTIAFWICASDTANYRGVVDNLNNSAAGWSVFFVGNKLYLTINTLTDGIPTTTTATTNVWQHWAVVHVSGTSAFWYLNGLQDSSSATNWGNASASSAGLKIGRKPYTSGSDFFSGSLDDVQIYNRALPAAEVAALRRDSLAGCPATINMDERFGYFQDQPAGGSKVPVIDVLAHRRAG